MDQWKAIYKGMIGMRPVKIERGNGGILRVCTPAPGASNQIKISAATDDELRERLISYGAFTDSQAKEIVGKILKW